MPPTTELPGEALLDDIAGAISTRGYDIRHDFLPESVVAALDDEIRALDRRDFTLAGTGRDQGHNVDTRIRSDKILWLEGSSRAVRDYLACTEAIRLGLNKRLFLGLFDFECHYARYEHGDKYNRHVDAFKGARNRVLSSVLYLNRDWGQADGGELAIYDDNESALLELVRPEYNTSVLFLSERFPHEVRPTSRERLSVTGWFRVNAAVENALIQPGL